MEAIRAGEVLDEGGLVDDDGGENIDSDLKCKEW